MALLQTSLRTAIARIACIFLFLNAFSAIQAAPYPPGGLPAEWEQPDGTTLKLRMFGDEFYARTETESGRTVIFDHNQNAYYFARLSENGTALESTGELANNSAAAPPAVPDGTTPIRLPPEQRKEIWQANHEKWVPDEEANWKTRVEAARQRRNLALSGEEQAIQQSESPEYTVTGGYVGLTILVQFPDDPNTGTSDPVTFPTTQAKVQRYSNETGYADDGNTGSVRDYFFEQSLGLVDYTQEVTTVVTLPNPRNWYNYSDHPTNSTLRGSGEAGRLVVRHAVAQLQTEGYDFTNVSVGSNDRIIATNVLFAGATSGVWSEGLWPHRWVIDSGGINVGTAQNPRYIYDYQITNAQTPSITIGTFCHENGHLLLKLPDLYDTNSDNGSSAGIGQHGLMGSGNHVNSGRTPAPINAYFKDVSGWMNVTDLTASSYTEETLSTNNNEAHRIYKPGSLTEYFIVENRGEGDPWAAYVPDKGIMIWHIDETVNGNRNQQMTSSLHYEVSVEQADGEFDLENNSGRGDSTDLFDIFDGLFNDSTVPDANWWDGATSGIHISVLDPPGQDMRVRFGSQPPNTVTIQAPVFGTKLLIDEPFTIRWNGTFVPNVNIDLYKNGSFHSTIATNIPNDGVYTWTPDTSISPGSDYTIRVRHVADSSIAAFSETFELLSALFHDDFESGTFSGDWTITGTNDYRTIVTSANTPYQGNWHVTMDASSSTGYSRNEMTLSLNLRRKRNVVLEFWAKEFSDETHAPPSTSFAGGADFDGVAISEDGNLWHEVQPLRSEMSATWQKFTVDLDAAISTYGLSYTNSFRIRFNHYDNYPISSDGFAFDNVLIVGQTLPPANSTIDLSSASDSGYSNSDNITNNPTPVFTGVTEPGAEITLVSNISGNIGSTTANGSGSWSVQPATALPNGSHSISVSGDAVSPALSVTIDTVGPSLTIGRAASQSDPASSGPVLFDAVFSQPVMGFTTAGISVSGSAAGNANISGGPANYTVSVSTISSEGTVQISSTAGVAVDYAGNGNIAPTTGDTSVILDGHGNSAASATILSLNTGGGNESGWLTSGDQDFFAFTLNSSKIVQVQSTGEVDTLGTVRDTEGTILNDPGADDNAGTGQNFSSSLLLVAGTYTVEVSQAGGSGAYGLLLNLSSPPVLINELDSFTGAGDTYEFIELFDGGEGSRTLDGMTLVFFRGTDQQVASAIDLDGLTTGAGGFFLIGNASVPNIDLALPDSSIRNGYDAVALYQGDATDFPEGTALTTQDLVDAVVYLATDTNTNDLLLPLLNPSEAEITEAENGFALGQSVQRIPDGIGGARSTSGFVAAAPTPGGPNQLPPAPDTIDLPAGSDSGISSLDNLTNHKRPQFTGTATPGSLVEISSNRDGVLGVAPALRNGTFDLPQTSIELSEGSHTISASTQSTGETGATVVVEIDTTPTAVTVEQAPTQDDPTGTTPVEFLVAFDAPVSGFENSDLTISGSSMAAATVSGGPAVYSVFVDTNNEEGLISLSVPGGVTVDDAGNPNAPSTSLDNTVNLDLFGDIASGTETPVILESGIINLTGWIQLDDKDAFVFTIAKPKLAIIQTSGGTDTIGAIYSEDGTRLNMPGLDEDSGVGRNFLISVPLGAGTYTVEVSSHGVSGTGAYILNIDATSAPYVQPDFMVSSSSATGPPAGDNVYDTFIGQSYTLSSRRASPIAGKFQLQNDGEVPDNFLVSASKGNSLYSVRYTTWKDGNISAGLFAGTHMEYGIGVGEESPTILAVIQPNKKKLRKKIKRRRKNGKVRRKIKWLKKTHSLNVSATSDASGEKRDVARLVIRSY